MKVISSVLRETLYRLLVFSINIDGGKCCMVAVKCLMYFVIVQFLGRLFTVELWYVYKHQNFFKVVVHIVIIN